MSALDLDAFFRIGDFAVPATFRPTTGIPKIISVIFISENTALTFAIIEADSSNPVAICRTSDITGIDIDSTLQIDGVTWKVSNLATSSSGVTKIGRASCRERV